MAYHNLIKVNIIAFYKIRHTGNVIPSLGYIVVRYRDKNESYYAYHLIDGAHGGKRYLFQCVCVVFFLENAYQRLWLMGYM